MGRVRRSDGSWVTNTKSASELAARTTRLTRLVRVEGNQYAENTENCAEIVYNSVNIVNCGI